MVAPVAIKAAQNSGATLLIAGIAALVLLRGAKLLPDVTGVSDAAKGAVGIAKAPGVWIADEFEDLWNPPSGQFSPKDPLAELRQDAMTVKRYSSKGKAFALGFFQGEDEEDFGPAYYDEVHYDDDSIPIAVPVKIHRESRQLGEKVRGWLF